MTGTQPWAISHPGSLNRMITSAMGLRCRPLDTGGALQRDHIREHPRVQFLTKAQVLTQPDFTHRRDSFFKPLRIQHGCYHCGYGEFTGLPSWWKYCPSCHTPLKQEKSLQLELNQQL
jgi:hypothetical protein